MRLAMNVALLCCPVYLCYLCGDRGEPGRFSQAHEGVAYGCCVPALTRFTYPHCPGPPRLTLTPAETAEADELPIVGHRWTRFKGKMENGRVDRMCQEFCDDRFGHSALGSAGRFQMSVFRINLIANRVILIAGSPATSRGLKCLLTMFFMRLLSRG
jgi:hypothetical protein